MTSSKRSARCPEALGTRRWVMEFIDRPSPNFDTRPDGAVIDMLVLHYTGMTEAAAALERLCDAAAKVSCHYFIGEDGEMNRLVDEGNRAWHAGVSFWRGATDCNARSIGIELQNPGHDFGYRNFTEAQMQSLERLALDILSRHPIPPGNVLGHSDIAPARKMDPGSVSVLGALGQLSIRMSDEADGEDGEVHLKRAGNNFRSLLLQRLDDDSPISKAEVFYYLAEVSIREGDNKKAKQMLERALSNDRTLEQAQALLDELQG